MENKNGYRIFWVEFYDTFKSPRRFKSWTPLFLRKDPPAGRLPAEIK